ncbi:CobW family GTP-binding protein [Methylophaga sp.]|uniref:CobW family GTP-binding protein n=1 Tax=Methylophaga sp. TaxID=2024840 RepID=UPI003A905029
MNADSMQPIPTNIITGFLGVGKTTAIMSLLKKKPETERWAVLVNEFGEVGLDKALLSSDSSESDGLIIKEVAGGCMCCTAGLPVTVALNQILREVQPDRLLIEPSGLGHPKEVLDILTSRQYRDWIDLAATITLVDARHFSDERYITHEIFVQQLEVADLIVVNKYDQQQKADLETMQNFLHQFDSYCTPTHHTEWGELSLSYLDMPSSFKRAVWQKVHEPRQDQKSSQKQDESGLDVYEHQDDGWQSLGFRFDNTYQFDESALLQFCRESEVERLKAVVSTEKGTLFINQVDTELHFSQNSVPVKESLIEFISATPFSSVAIQAALSDCVIKRQ